MKFSKYFMLAGAAAMLTACSSEEPFVGPDNNGNPDDVVYAKFNIAMAEGNGTRAAGFDNGTADEYAVDNGKILIFGIPNNAGSGTIDLRKAAVYVGNAEFSKDDLQFDATNKTDQLDAIGTSVKASFKKGTFSSSSYEKFYGVVVLNYSDAWLPSVGVTFGDWVKNAEISAPLKNDDGHFVMTNAALYTTQVTVLSEILKDKVKDLESDVTEDAATFTVQRVAAKVELTNQTDQTKEFEVSGDEYAGYTATLTGWGMDLTRKDTYPVQNVWESAVLSLYSNTNYTWLTSGSPKRCHWGFSKTYSNTYKDADDCKTDYNFIGGTPAMTYSAAPAYIYENTMSNHMMTKGQTTRMVIKASFKNGDDAETLYKFKHATELFTAATLKAKVEEVIENLKVSNVTVSVDENLDGGWKVFSSVVSLTGTGATDIVKQSVAEAMGVYNQNDAEVAVYANGECYYNVYIKHFADEQENVTPGVNTSIYDEKHIGRYGVVRNNWYAVTVNSISGPGLPSNPEPDPSKPVDEIEDDSMRHMQVTCNILNWTKRSQEVDL